MEAKKIDYTSDSRVKAHKKYMEKFCEIKVRMTPSKRESIKIHADTQGESTTAFINRAIDETIQHDSQTPSLNRQSAVGE